MNICKLILLLGVAASSLSAQWLSGGRFLSDTSGGATTCWEELYTNGSAAVCIKAPNAITTEFTLELPDALPTATTRCLQVTTTGVMEYSAGPCGTSGGGSSSGIADQIQLSDGAGNFTDLTNFYHDGEQLVIPRSTATPTTEGAQVYLFGGSSHSDFVIDVSTTYLRFIANSGGNQTVQLTNVGAGSLNLEMGGHVTFATDSLYNVGTAASRALSVFADDVVTEELLFRQQGAGAHEFSIRRSASNNLRVEDSAGGGIMSWNTLVSPYTVYFSAHSRPNTNNTYDQGTTSLRWKDGWYAGTVYAPTFEVATEVLPDTDGGATIGNASKQFDAHLEDVVLYSTLLPNGALGGQIGAPGNLIGGVFSSDVVVGRASTITGAMYFYRAAGSGDAALRGATYSSGTAIEVVDALAIGSSASFYIRTFSGADVNCATGGPGATPVSDGWMGYRLDTNEIQICDGGAVVVK